MPDYRFMGARYARDVGAPIDYRRVSVAETQDLSIVQTLGKAQRWDFRIPLETDVFGRERLMELISADINRRKSSNSFEIMVPQPVGYPDAPDDIAVRVQAAASAGADDVHVRRTSATSYALRTGRFIRFAGDDKVYQVVVGRNLRIINRAFVIKVYPSLRKAIPAYDAANPSAATEVLVGTAAAPVMATVVWHPDAVGAELRYMSGNIFRYDARFAEVV